MPMSDAERKGAEADVKRAIESGNIMDRVIALEAAVRLLLAAHGGRS